MRVQLVETKDLRRLHIGSIFVDLNESDYQDLINIFSKTPDMGNVSDGYHTFNELYEFRKVYNAVLFNQWAMLGKYEVHKSRKHHDGTLCFGGGWFIVVAVLPGGQITNHYEEKDWELFKIPEEDVAKYEFDGHTSKDVINRLLALYQHEYSLISNERFWRDLLLNNGNQ